MADMINTLLSKELPEVSCVLVDVEGAATQVQVDMTPMKRATEGLLGGKVTFLGQWEPLEVFLLIRREDEAEAAGVAKSKADLPKPFDVADFRGPVLLTRSDEQAEPVNFTLAEYTAFKAKAPEAWQEAGDDDDDEEEEEEDDSDDEEEEEEEEGDEDGAYDSDAADADEAEACKGDAAAFRELLRCSALEKFEAKEGRSATAEEMGKIEAALDAKFGDNAEEEADFAARAEAIILDKIVTMFTAEHGRAPTKAEVDETLDRLRKLDENEENIAQDLNVDADAEEEEEEDEEEEEEEEPGEADILECLVVAFKERNSRDPTEEEMKQWMEVLKEAAAGDAGGEEEEEDEKEEQPSSKRQKK